jgi:hypothetical protein
MIACTGKSSACQGGPARRYRDPLDRRSTVHVMCAECAAAHNSMGVGLVEIPTGSLADRIAAAQPAPEPWKPAWLRNLTGRDETGRLVTQ